MRKKWYLIIGLAVLALTAGCQGTQSSREVSDPLKEVEGKEEFEKVGAYIEVPAGAENTKYYIIDDEIAEIRFDFNGASYIYRSSNQTEDVADLGVKFDKEQSRTVEAGKNGTAAEVRVDENGGQLAQWQYGENYYSLYTDGQAEDTVFDSLCRELLEDSADDAQAS